LVGFPVGFTLSDVVSGTGPEDRPPRQSELFLDPVSDPSEGVLRPVPNRGNPVLSRFVETTRRLRFGLEKPDPSPSLQRTFGWIQPFAFLEGSFQSPFARDIDAHCDVAKLLSRRFVAVGSVHGRTEAYVSAGRGRGRLETRWKGSTTRVWDAIARGNDEAETVVRFVADRVLWTREEIDLTVEERTGTWNDARRRALGRRKRAADDGIQGRKIWLA